MLITGMHRSGTTLIGRMLQLASDDVAILHEPLNHQLGVKGVPCWYPSCHEETRPLVKNILSLDVTYKR